jgi:hypothetical protein
VLTPTPKPLGPSYLAAGGLTEDETKYWVAYVENYDFCRGRNGMPSNTHSTLAAAFKQLEETMKANDPRVEATWVGKREKDGKITLLYMVQGSAHYERRSFSIEPLRNRITGTDDVTRNLMNQARQACR